MFFQVFLLAFLSYSWLSITRILEKSNSIQTIMLWPYPCYYYYFIIYFRPTSLTLFSHFIGTKFLKFILMAIGWNSKVAYRIQISKKTFCQNSDKFGCSFIKNDIMFMYLLCFYKKNHYFKSICSWYIKLHHVYFNDFDMPFKNVIRLYNLISMKSSSP